MRKRSIRKLRKAEAVQRGCYFCEHKVNKWDNSRGCNRSCCPFEKCPYGVLDKYDTYDDFVESEDCKRQFLLG